MFNRRSEMKSFFELKKRSILTLEAMSNVLRGYYQELDAPTTGTCGYKSLYGTIQCNVSKAEALFMVEEGGYWCCESCASTSYCGKK